MSESSTLPAEAWLKKLNQERLLQHLARLSSQSRAPLMAQLSRLDWPALEVLLRAPRCADAAPTGDLAPLQPYLLSPGAQAEKQAGESLIKKGAVALFTVAGGQGSRLGYEGPKGCFGVTPVTQSPLFQVFAEKIRVCQARYGVELPWVLMTSPQNDEQTKSFFQERDYFGLKKTQVYFFTQGEMPLIDAQTGDLLLESADSLALGPDGHGGSLKGLYKSGVLAQLEALGITHLSYFQVDNPLIKPVDPVFIGAHILSGSEFSSKATPKKNAQEKVGVFGLRGGQLGIIEYTDMPAELAAATDKDGQLRYRWGNAAIHLISVPFIHKVAQSAALPYHRAKKKAAFWDGARVVTPEVPNAIKFEQFIFDAIPMAQKPMVMAIRSQEEFSPVKNATGVDSPATCRNDQLLLWAAWLKDLGVEVPQGADGVPIAFEISPLFADSAEALAEQYKKGKVPGRISENLVLKP